MAAAITMRFKPSKGSRVYLARPYTHDGPEVRTGRYIESSKAVVWMINALRINVFSPVVHCHALVDYSLPFDWGFWAEYDKAFISVCEELWVLCIPGWDHSVGVTAEIAIANELGLKVRYLIPNGNEYSIFDYPPEVR